MPADTPLQRGPRQTATPTSGIQVIAHTLNSVKRLGQSCWTEAYAAAKRGHHTRELDKALPGTHTKTLYDCLARSKAAILAQMRTEKCRLISYLHTIGAEDTDLCECGQRETVKHVMLDCRRWTLERQELRAAVGNRD